MKRLLIYSLAIATIAWSLSFAFISPVSAASINNGDVIKLATSPAVYYVTGGKKMLMPNRGVYSSWSSAIGDQNDKFATLRVVSDTDFGSLPFGPNMTVRPGTGLVKFTDSNDLFAIGYDNKLYKLYNENTKNVLYPNATIITLTESFRSNYYEYGNSVAVLTANSTYPDGTLVKATGDSDIYLIEDGKKRLVPLEVFNENAFKNQWVVTTDVSKYESGSAFIGKRDELQDVGFSYIITGCGVPNGRGQKTSTDGGLNWDACRATVCDNGYSVSNGACIIEPSSQTVTKNGYISKVYSVSEVNDTTLYWLSDVAGKGYYRFLYSDYNPRGNWNLAVDTVKINEGYLSRAYLNWLPNDTDQYLEVKVADTSKNTETQSSKYSFHTPLKQIKTETGLISSYGYSVAIDSQVGELTNVTLTVSGNLNGILEYRELYSNGYPMEDWVSTVTTTKIGDYYEASFHKNLVYGNTYTFEFRISSDTQSTYVTKSELTIR
jgi:hypothetical protein